VGRDLVLGAAEFAERREQNEIIERLFRQRQTERPGFRAVFRSGRKRSGVIRSASVRSIHAT
jgi:hypothetical protein